MRDLGMATHQRSRLGTLLAGLIVCIWGASSVAQTPNQIGELLPVDGRLPLALLERSIDDDVFATMQNLQSDDGDVILILRKGTMTLADLAAASLPAQTASAIEVQQSKRVLLHQPLIIEEDATLVLGADDHLILDRSSGSFLINKGRLFIDGGTIAGTDLPAAQNTEFRPFVVTIQRGAVQVDNGTFQNLGYAGAPTSFGVTIASNSLFLPVDPSWIRTSTFDSGVAVHKASDIDITDNVFKGTRDAAILLSGAQRVTVARNEIEGAGADGILVGYDTIDAVITRNQITHAGKNGLSIRTSTCVDINHNEISRAASHAIVIDGASDVSISTNSLLDNARAAIAIRDQDADMQTLIINNTLAGNRTGIDAMAPAEIVLMSNDLRQQFPRFLGGDLNRHTRHIASNLQGEIALVLAPRLAQPIEMSAATAQAPACMRSEVY